MHKNVQYNKLWYRRGKTLFFKGGDESDGLASIFKDRIGTWSSWDGSDGSLQETLRQRVKRVVRTGVTRQVRAPTARKPYTFRCREKVTIWVK